MADVFSKTKRSEVMARITYKDTKPELKVRKYLHARGFRYSLHIKTLPGTPDIVLRKYKTAIQVRGCFWHQHSCRDGHIPKSRTDYWSKKLLRNKERDTQSDINLIALGWKLIVVWECELRSKERLEKKMGEVVNYISK